MKERTDKERLDAIQKLSAGNGIGWSIGRYGYNNTIALHEINTSKSNPNIRKAIDCFLDKEEAKNENK